MKNNTDTKKTAAKPKKAATKKKATPKAKKVVVKSKKETLIPKEVVPTEPIAETKKPEMVIGEPIKPELPTVEKKKVVGKKPDSKPKTTKVPKKKAAFKAKKTVSAKPKKDTATKKEVKIDIPLFNDVTEMREFCVAVNLNKVDGYIPSSKQKKTLFLAWIKANIKHATPFNHQNLTDNPHSPSAGIGEIETVNEENNNPTENKSLYGEVKIDVPPLKTSDNTNEMPTALTGMSEAMNYGKTPEQNNTTPEAPKQPEIGKGNAELDNYALSILSHIMESFSVKIHGRFERAEYDRMVTDLDKRFIYETKTEGGGTYLILKDGYENQARVPATGFLPM